MKLHLVALASYIWGAIVCWLAVGCSSAAIDRTVSTIDPYQTCMLAARLSPRTPELAAKSGMTAEQWSESVCRIAEGLVNVAESIATATCDRLPQVQASGVAGGPSWP
jgi:hypothetical protein